MSKLPNMTANQHIAANENKRNAMNTRAFVAMVKIAFGDVQVMVGHHISFEDKEYNEDEIPSADALLFNQDIMRRVFGRNGATQVMIALASVHQDKRQAVIEGALRDHGIPF